MRAAVVGLLLVMFVPGVAVSAVAPSPSPSRFDDGLDTTINAANDTAPVGGVFNVYGSSSCEQTVVTLDYPRSDGQLDFRSRPANTTFDRGSGRYNYTLQYRVPAEAVPGRGRLWADTLCGNPDAEQSPRVPVTITARPSTASPSRSTRTTSTSSPRPASPTKTTPPAATVPSPPRSPSQRPDRMPSLPRTPPATGGAKDTAGPPAARRLPADERGISTSVGLGLAVAALLALAGGWAWKRRGQRGRE